MALVVQRSREGIYKHVRAACIVIGFGPPDRVFLNGHRIPFTFFVVIRQLLGSYWSSVSFLIGKCSKSGVAFQIESRAESDGTSYDMFVTIDEFCTNPVHFLPVLQIIFHRDNRCQNGRLDSRPQIVDALQFLQVKTGPLGRLPSHGAFRIGISSKTHDLNQDSSRHNRGNSHPQVSDLLFYIFRFHDAISLQLILPT